MIWHAVEVWLLLLAMFVIGCMFGSALHLVLARTAVAEAQEDFADSVARVIDGVSRRLGFKLARRPRRYVHEPVEPERLYPEDYRPEPIEPTVYRDEVVDYDESFDSAYDDAAAHHLPATVEMPADRGPVEDEHALEGESVGREGVAPAWDDGEEWDEHPADRDVQLVPALPDRELPPPTDDQLKPHTDLPSMRPVGLAAPRNGVPDDLQRIRGIGKKNEEFLNSIGIFHFGQIAAWTPAEARWVAAHLAFPERIERDDWIGQATVLATGGNTGYVKAARKEAEADELPRRDNREAANPD